MATSIGAQRQRQVGWCHAGSLGGALLALVASAGACSASPGLSQAPSPAVAPTPPATAPSLPAARPDDSSAPSLSPQLEPVRVGVCSTDGWCWDNPLPHGEDLNAVWGRSAHDVFAVGEQGTIMRYDGDRWRRKTAPSAERLVGVWGTGQSQVFAVSTAGGVWRVDAMPAKLAHRESSELHALWGDGEHLFAVGAAGTVLRHDGDRWRRDSIPTNATLRAVSGSSRYRVFAVGDDGTILRFNGWSWHGVRPPLAASFQRVWVSSTLLVVSSSRRVFIHDGKGWLRSAFEPIVGCWGRARFVRCLAGQRTWSLHRGEWTPHPAPPLSWQVRQLWSPDGRSAFAVGDGGLIYHFDRHRWVEHSHGERADLKAVWGSSATSIWAVGASALVMHSDGRRWHTAADLPSVHAFNDVWGAARDDVYAVGNGGLLAHYDGASWSQRRAPTSHHLHAVWGSGPRNVYVVGDGGTALRFDGAKWLELPLQKTAGAPSRLAAIVGRDASSVWLLGRLGRSWQRIGHRWMVRPSHPLNDAWMGAAGEIVTVGRGVWWLEGDRWQHQHRPEHRLDALWSNDGHHFYAVGQHGTILHRDHLGTWRRQRSGTDAHLRDLWSADGTDLFVVGDGGTILRRRRQSR